MERRHFITTGLAGMVLLGSRSALADHARRSLSDASASTNLRVANRLFDLPSPGPLGIQLPSGYRARLLARSGDLVEGTGLRWHGAPDGGGVLPLDDGGWIYVSNSELPDGTGGASAIEFAPDGEIRDARRILDGTNRNCAGGMTPWGTWLSCEEDDVRGRVWECDPTGTTAPVARTAMGLRNHEAAAVDLADGCVYLTEDDGDGRLWRFTPDVRDDLSLGLLEALLIDRDADAMAPGEVARCAWRPVGADEERTASPGRAATTPFRGGEGAWMEGSFLLFTTKHDRRLWEYDVRNRSLRLLLDAALDPMSPIQQLDNITVHPVTGDVYACEDVGNMEIFRMQRRGDTLDVTVAMRVAGHEGSEMTGVAFSPDGTRMYCSSQRGSDGRGETYEISGPFLASSAARTVLAE